MLAPPWISVPPPGCGGIEFVVALLCDALVEQGRGERLGGTSGKAEQQMAELVEKAVGIDLSRCRQTAAQRFAPDRVATAYEAVYLSSSVG
jgi:hypothetical protein